MVIGYYNDSVIYTSLYGKKDVVRRYEEGVMSVSVKEFQTCALHIFDDVKNSNWKSSHAWIVQGQLN